MTKPRRMILEHKSRRSTNDYPLSIRLPISLLKEIDRIASAQLRTRASLIRQTLADKFQEVA